MTKDGAMDHSYHLVITGGKLAAQSRYEENQECRLSWKERMDKLQDGRCRQL